MPDFLQINWDQPLEADCRALVKLAFQEDLAGQQDWTTASLVPEDRSGTANIVAREAAVVAGLPTVQVVLDCFGANITAANQVADGDRIDAGTMLVHLQGNVRDLLTVERTLLNILARLMGVATLASRYVAKLAGTRTHVYDTRKTTPGWRLLEKYAARCGGARNHRRGLYDAILIKDNHLAGRGKDVADVAAAVADARQFLGQLQGGMQTKEMLLEVEVDTMDQLASVLPARPDIVLLDNMSLCQLYEAVKLRNALSPQVQLEASGGVQLERLAEIAATGVERISIGALTHSARSLDLGMDWGGLS
ncbi:MAG: carboxylating nicotinate-nucleotide diphosphorylase [Pirellulales bacterium]|nr:carboxylating nicotinate-nucleotide diphosphorylase [Pirellulales bacterium]